MSVLIQVFFDPAWRTTERRQFEVLRLPFDTVEAAIDAATRGKELIVGSIVMSRPTEEPRVRQITCEKPIAFRPVAVGRANPANWTFLPDRGDAP